MSPNYWRLSLFLLMLGAFTALMVWLIQSFLELYRSVRYNPILGTVLIGILVLILLIFVGATVYYLFLFRRNPASALPKVIERPALPQSAGEKVSATQQNLALLEQQLQQVQDQVSRQALLEKSLQLAKTLAQPRLKVAVFGTGSAGKTSLVNALLGRKAGEVGATLGTTTGAALYRWQLPGIPEPVEIVDSPGILEIGSEGEARELEARAQAVAADLVLAVVDGDLRQSEYEPLIALIQLGKRSLLILNKADRYTSNEQDLLLARLRERVSGVISYEDVLLAAANPAPVGSVHPTPQIKIVRDRVQAILYAEGPSLAVDNALLQSQQLGDEARRILQAQLQKQAEQIVERFQWVVTAVVFANPIPAVDLLATAAINAQMVVEIGSVYGCQMNMKQGRELAFSLAKTLGSLGLVEGAVQITTGILTALAETTIVGYLITAPIQAASAGYLTRIAGRSFIEYFQRNQNWGEGGIQAVVKEQVKRTQKSDWTKTFVQEAIQRVFKPGLLGSGQRQDPED